jgi:hypothetical protein
MKATKIYYQKCFNLGNYQNEVIGIELEIDEKETAKIAIENAKKFVQGFSESNKSVYERCKAIIEKPDLFTVKEYEFSKNFVENYDADLPF